MLEYLETFKAETIEITEKVVGPLPYVLMKFSNPREAESFQRNHIEEFKRHNLTCFRIILPSKPITNEQIEAHFEEHGVVPDLTPEGGLVVVSMNQCYLPNLPELYFGMDLPKLTTALTAIWDICTFSHLLINEEVAYCYFDRVLSSEEVDCLADYIFKSQLENYDWSFSQKEIRKSLKNRRFYLGPE